MSTAAPSAPTEAARRIFAAAERLFAEHGFDGVSIRDIARAAEVSKANVFHHYANKWELYRAVIDASAQQLGELLERLEPGDRDADVEQLLTAFAGGHLTCLLEQPHATGLFLRQMLDPGRGEDRQLVGNVLQQRFDLIIATLNRLIERGRLSRGVDASVLAMLLLGGNVAYFLRSRLPPADLQTDQLPADPGAYARAVIGLLSRGILPGGATASTPSTDDEA